MQYYNSGNEFAQRNEDLALESSNQELSLETARELIRSLQSRQAQLEQQVAELQRSVGFHQALIDSLPSSIAVMDKEGVIVAVNKSWLDFGNENDATDGSNSLGVNYLQVCQSGYSGADVTGTSTMAAGIGEVLDSKRTEFKHEYPCQSPKEKRWFQAIVHAMPSSFPGAVVSHLDVTGLTEETAHRKLAESLLRESEQRYQYVEDATLDGIWDWHIPTGKCYYSSQWAQLLGYEPDEIPSTVDFFFEISHPEDAAIAHNLLREHRAANSQLKQGQFRLRTKGGEYRWFLDRGKVVEHDASGEPIRMVGIISDITNRKRAESALLAGERELRLIINSMPGPVSRVDRELRYVFANDKYEKIFGLPAEMVVGRTMPEVIGQQRFDFVEPYVRRALAGEMVSFESLVEISTGEIQTTLTHFLPDIDEQNCIIGFVVIGFDITDRKLAEQAIKERTAFLEALLDSSNDGILVVDGEGKKLLHNSRLTAVWKIPQEIADDRDDARQFAFVTGLTKKPQEFVDKVAYLYANPSEVGRDEIELIDGTTLDRYSAPVCYKDGTYYGRIWTFHDITELRSAQAEVEARERELRLIADKSPGPFARVDRNLRYVYLNKFYETASGQPMHALVGKSVPELLGEQLWEQVRPKIECALAGKHITFDSAVNLSSGELRYLRLNLIPELDSNSQVVGFYMIGFDITESKVAELEKQEALDRIQKLTSSLPGCVYQFRMQADGTFRFPYASEGMREIFGLDPEDLREDISKLYALYHPDDESGLKESITISASGLTPWNHEFRIRFEDGTVRWVSGNSIPEREADGSILWHGFMSDITARKQSETALRIRDKALNSISQGVLITDREGQILSANPAFYAISGYSEADLSNQNTTMFRSGRRVNETLKALLHAREEGIEFSGEVIDTRKNGTTYWNDLTISPVRDEHGKLTHFVGVSRDITARKQSEEDRNRLESQLRQAQRLESIGRLAGGVAHDFNNMLGVILGHAELGLLQTQPEDRIYSNLEQIQKAALRSADLTRQLLAFARKQTVSPRPLDLNSNVEQMLSLIARLIGEDISIKWKPCNGLWLVKMDSSQMEQILTNLCVNARDAILGVGTITIETSNCSISADDCARWIDAVAGEYVRLTLNDNGIGMDAQTLSQIFEPFFTTKTDGKGTGLGLATVYGAVRQNKGFVAVTSALGEGTTFNIYLPRYLGRANLVQDPEVPDQPPRGRETILVVEDEPALLELTSVILRSQGYNVLAAATPAEAQRLALENSNKIALLLTDVIMPEMNGRDLAAQLQKVCPNIKRLFMSGYTADVIAQSGALEDGTYFLQKPFTPSLLAKKLREVLDANGRAPVL